MLFELKKIKRSLTLTILNFASTVSVSIIFSVEIAEVYNFKLYAIHYLLLFISLFSLNITAYQPGFLNLNIILKVFISYLIPFFIIGLFFPFSTYYQNLLIILVVSSSFILGHILYLYRKKSISPRCPSVAIYGAGIAGRQIAEDLLNGSKYKPICFIDDSLKLEGDYINGLKVLSYKAFLTSKFKTEINSILIAIPSLDETQRQQILKKLSSEKFSVRILPRWEQLTGTNPTAFQLKKVNFADMFTREEADLDLSKSDYFSGKCVLVSGGGGSIGSELCNSLLATEASKIIVVDHSELALFELEQKLEKENLNKKISYNLGSVLDPDFLTSIFSENAVDIFFHAAAYKHVPIVESNAASGFKNNFLGTKVVYDLCSKNDISDFVLVSTDKSVRPTNLMGATKRLCELYCLSNSKKNKMNISIVRFGNVFGSSGSVLNQFKKQIAKGGPVLVTDPEIERYFMSKKEAASLLLKTASIGDGANLYALDMGKPVKVIDLARKIIEHSGFRPFIKSFGETGNMEIRFTGLRPGEKLYEELLVSGNFSNTSHKKIFLIREDIPNITEVNEIEEKILTSLRNNDINSYKEILKNKWVQYSEPNTK